jgi:hypothetical protein
VLILLPGETFNDGLKGQFATFFSALVAGLPVWFIPWRKAQGLAVREDAQGEQERRSVVRKIYLYAFVLFATLTMLGSAIYVLSRLLTLALGGGGAANLLRDIALPAAYALIAAVVWVYHGLALRGDGRRYQAEQAARRSGYSVIVVDEGEAKFGNAFIAELKRALPGVNVASRGFGGTGDAAVATSSPAQLVVGTWRMLGVGKTEIAGLAEGARKLVVPTPAHGFEWVGVDTADAAGLGKDAARAAKGIIEGETARPRRGLHPVVIVVLGLVGLCVLVQVILFLASTISLRF